jgi:hypothetical protein
VAKVFSFDAWPTFLVDQYRPRCLEQTLTLIHDHLSKNPRPSFQVPRVALLATRVIFFRITFFSLDGLTQRKTSGGGRIDTRLPHHSSRFSFRRPQCLSFDESYSGIGFAPCNASIMPTWACIKGPRSSAAMITASPAACHSGLCCFDLGSARVRPEFCHQEGHLVRHQTTDEMYIPAEGSSLATAT